jgi:hypothetical protein
MDHFPVCIDKCNRALVVVRNECVPAWTSDHAFRADKAKLPVENNPPRP